MSKLNYDTIIKASVSDDQTRLSNESAQNVFGELASSTRGHNDREVWEGGLRQFEDQYMEEYFDDKEEAKKKDGTWKYRTYLPKAWVSGKCVCGQAIEHGIAIDENSAKTAIEGEIKEAKALLDPKGPKRKFQDTMNTARKIFDQLHVNSKRNLMRDFGIDIANAFWLEDEEND